MQGPSTLRLLTAGALSVAILLEGRLALSPYTVWAISLPLLLWCAAPYHAGFWRGLREQNANADMLISMGVWSAFFFSTAAILMPQLPFMAARGHRLGTMGALIVVPMLGRWFERRMTEQSGAALGKLLRRIPRAARRLGPEGEANVSLGEVRVGDRIRVGPGEPIPVDGKVVEGSSRVDESLWTGEATAVEKVVGSKVLSGTQNKGGELVIEVRRLGSRTALSRLVESVFEGAAVKSVRAGIADGIARGYVPAVVITGVGAALLWSWKGPEPRLAHAFTALAMVIVVAVPWALEMAAPAALAVGFRRAAKLGIRIRNPAVLEMLERPDVLVLDKKGILTEGRPRVAEVIVFGRWKPKDLLRYAAAAERRSTHPFSEAVRMKVGESDLPEAESVEIYPGRGVAATFEGRHVLVGSPAWLTEKGVETAPQDARVLRGNPASLMAVAVDGKIAGAITFLDPLRPGIAEGVRQLKQMGIEVVLASGDRNAVAHRVAEEAGIGRVYAEVAEEEKVQIVRHLQARGKRVVMAGEGVRDAAALSCADLGIAVMPSGAESLGTRPALGAGIDLAEESADILLLRRDLEHLSAAIRLALEIRRTIKQNLRVAFGLHILLIPAAAGAFYSSFGIGMQPSHLAAAAGISLVVIIGNSLRQLAPAVKFLPSSYK